MYFFAQIASMFLDCTVRYKIIYFCFLLFASMLSWMFQHRKQIYCIMHDGMKLISRDCVVWTKFYGSD